MPYLKEKLYFFFVWSKKQLVELDTDCSAFQNITYCVADAHFKTDLIWSFISTEHKSRNINALLIIKWEQNLKGWNHFFLRSNILGSPGMLINIICQLKKKKKKDRKVADF